MKTETLTPPTVGDVAFSERYEAIAAAFVEAQSHFDVAAKDKTADVQPKDGSRRAYSYTYADLEAISSACRAHLNRAGIGVLQPLQVNGTLVTVTTILLHRAGQWMRQMITLNAGSAAPQQIGIAASYGRRYSLAAMCGVVAANEDPDANQPTNLRGGDEWRDSERGRWTPPAEEESRRAPVDSPEDEAELLVRDIDAATSVPVLNALTNRLLTLPDDLKDAPRKALGRRLAELRTAGGSVNRTPGQEG